MIAKQDPAYLSADEFDREEVMAQLVDVLKQQQGDIDVGDAEITVTIHATLGDYSTADEGFPVNLFVPNMHFPIGVNKLFFRNFDAYRIFAATRDEGKALRDRIGTQPLAADVTLTNIETSTTRPRTFEGFVSRVVYTARDGLVVGEFTATEDAHLPAAEAADMVVDIAQHITQAAGIPALGTSWEEAKALLQDSYPFSGSDDFAYLSSGKVIAYQYDASALIRDEAHDATRPFNVYLQQVDGAWRTTRGFKVDLNGVDMLSTKGAGPGLACYTPHVLDRCAVLQFSPSDSGHVLSRAYGVIELERSGSPKKVFEAFVSNNTAAFDGFATKVDYDAESLKQGDTPKYIGIRGVSAYAAGAGEVREGTPIYDPLENTSGINSINREIGLFAVDGAADRVPMVFVLQ
ncbi:hypothetical protein OS189_17100 [Sulfitobacter sp. F26169L]|uniref:hypothetical protein n=1 Tax=Sulfitobacter sp. F26169L TaxID=2996015 RepID=UPI002260832D|nr:hypothetical protein [Sulfitobacter sp. F26169L]MCX7568062.1 hypothetical protein [Sulfitobacter sp. F26169L]